MTSFIPRPQKGSPVRRLLPKLVLPQFILAALLSLFAVQAQALFLTPDTLNPAQPGVGTNRYAYSGGDPINRSDPGGQAFGDWFSSQSWSDQRNQELADSHRANTQHLQSQLTGDPVRDSGILDGIRQSNIEAAGYEARVGTSRWGRIGSDLFGIGLEAAAGAGIPAGRGLGAVSIVGRETAAVAGATVFNATETAIIAEARGIMSSGGMTAITEAHAAGASVTVQIGGRVIQYEPGLAASGMTMFGENGFLIGREAFSRPDELGRTVLHELHRLATSQSAGGVSAELARRETDAAFEFAERAIAELYR